MREPALPGRRSDVREQSADADGEESAGQDQAQQRVQRARARISDRFGAGGHHGSALFEAWATKCSRIGTAGQLVGQQQVLGVVGENLKPGGGRPTAEETPRRAGRPNRPAPGSARAAGYMTFRAAGQRHWQLPCRQELPVQRGGAGPAGSGTV
ncbi:hypothetical protein ABZ626_38610 [Streptomyces longispororuber]|uniref:hypothetical protein n=1 Tax=Streptomyces longispororuber TaxID=68230 RepID=UPI0034081B86